MTRKKDKSRYFLISFACKVSTGNTSMHCVDGNFPSYKAVAECVSKLTGVELVTTDVAIINIYEFKNRSDYLEWHDTSENLQVKE